MPGVKVTIIPYPQPKSPTKEAEGPVKSAAPVLMESALPKTFEKKTAASAKTTEAAPVKPVVKALASASPSQGAAKAVPVPSAPFLTPPPRIVEEKVAASSKVAKKTPEVPVVEAQAPASHSLKLAKEVPVPLAPLPTPPSEIIGEKVTASSMATKAAPVKPAVEAQALASRSLEAAKAVPIPTALLQATPPEIALTHTQQSIRIPTFVSQCEGGVAQLVELSNTDAASWEHLVGLYFQESNRTPLQVALRACDGRAFDYPVPGLGKWTRDWRKVDWWEKYPTIADRWPVPAVGSIVANLVPQIEAGFRQQILEEAIRRWAVSSPHSVEGVVRRAGYMLKWDRPREFGIMSDIKKMPEGPQKERLVAQARQESPRFAEECMKDENCGM